MLTRVYFSCDVHGSELCFKKFINAAKYRIYKADVVILSGDLTGKALVPIIQEDDSSYRVSFLGSDETVGSQESLHGLEKRIRNVGYYHCIVSEDELLELKSEKSKLENLFSSLTLQRLEHWIRLAEESLKDTGIKCFMMPGNDDHPAVGQVIDKSDFVVNPEEKMVNVDKHHEMISLGFSNYTPWKTPRECSEEELAKKINSIVSSVSNIQNCIFNIHCPPYGSGLDYAPQLDENFRPVVSVGELLKVPVGSKAVLNAIKKHQPLVGLHGHIHESPGEVKIGRTLCLNPGSEYQNGILRGYLIDLDQNGLKHYLHVEA